jgi:hypothetical protein
MKISFTGDVAGLEFPMWDKMSCSELAQAIIDFKYTMSYIKVEQAIYDLYVAELDYAQKLYEKKCIGTGVGGGFTPEGLGLGLVCTENEVMQEVTECPECTKSNPPCGLPCRVVKKCVPIDAVSTDTTTTTTTNWLWLLLVAAGVYILLKKEKQ